MTSSTRGWLTIGLMVVVTACGGGGGNNAPATSTSTSRPDPLVTHRNPLGFTIAHPGGWRVDAKDDGLITVTSENESESVIVQPFLLRRHTDAASWLKQLPKTMPAVFAGATVEREKSTPGAVDEAALLMTFSRGGRQYRASAFCSVFRKSGMLFAIVAPADRFDMRKRELAAILKSFRVVDPSSAPGGQPALAFDRWTDPNEQAFSVEVPRGWKTEGGSARFAAVDVRSGIRSESPDGGAWVFSGDTELPTFTVPSQMLAMGGFREGMWYSPGYGVNMMVRSYESGPAFARWYAESVLAKRCGGVAIKASRDRADASEAINAIYGQLGPGVRVQLSTGEVAFTCGSHASPRRGYVFAGTLTTAAPMGALWNVQYLAGLLATAEQSKTAETALRRLLDSLQLNPDWVARQQHLTMATSQIVTRTNDAISGIIRDTYEQKWAVMDEVFRNWSNMTLGLTDLRDPDTGETYRVASGHNYYWKHGETVVGTSTYERPDINFTPLIAW